MFLSFAIFSFVFLNIFELVFYMLLVAQLLLNWKLPLKCCQLACIHYPHSLLLEVLIYFENVILKACVVAFRDCMLCFLLFTTFLLSILRFSFSSNHLMIAAPNLA